MQHTTCTIIRDRIAILPKSKHPRATRLKFNNLLLARMRLRLVSLREAFETNMQTHIPITICIRVRGLAQIIIPGCVAPWALVTLIVAFYTRNTYVFVLAQCRSKLQRWSAWRILLETCTKSTIREIVQPNNLARSNQPAGLTQPTQLTSEVALGQL